MADPFVAITATEIVSVAFGEFIKTMTKGAARKLTGDALRKAGDLREKIVNWFKQKQNHRAESAIAKIQQEGNTQSLNKLSTYLDDEMNDFPAFAQEIKGLTQQILQISGQKKIQFGDMKQDIHEGGKGNQFQGETISIGQIGDNIGHKGDIYQSGPPVSAAALLDKGTRLLEQGTYQQAADVLSESIKADPSLASAHYQLAVALLQGKRPKVLTRQTVEDVDRAISGALALEPNNGVFHIFRALVRHDYYEINRMRSPSPSAIEIMQSVGQYPRNKKALKQLLRQLPAMRNNPLYSSLNSTD